MRQTALISLIFLTKIIVAQNDSLVVPQADSLPSESKLNIIADERIEKLLEIKKANASNNPGIPGYRIQLFYGPRSEALEYQAEFLKLYLEIDCYLVYDAPYFKVRIGDFRDKYAARRVHLDLIESFPDSFILEDRINLPDLPSVE